MLVKRLLCNMETLCCELEPTSMSSSLCPTVIAIAYNVDVYNSVPPPPPGFLIPRHLLLICNEQHTPDSSGSQSQSTT